jgi:hypothetical protein
MTSVFGVLRDPIVHLLTLSALLIGGIGALRADPHEDRSRIDSPVHLAHCRICRDGFGHQPMSDPPEAEAPESAEPSGSSLGGL